MSVILEVGTPKRRVVTTKEEYIDFIQKNNGVFNLYETIYKYKELRTQWRPDYDTAIINCLFFDADSENSLKTTITFHKHLKDRNIKHYIKQSSYMRFHIFVVCEIADIKNKKVAIRNAMISLCHEAGLSFGKANECDFDEATFGDLARLTAIAGTYKLRKKNWCNYITEEDLFSVERLKLKSTQPGGRKTFYGEENYTLDYFDTEPMYASSRSFDITEFDASLSENHIKILPPFLKKILADYNGYGNWKNRWRFAIFCRDLGYPPKVIDAIAKKHFSQVTNMGSLNGKGSNYDHFVKTKVVDYVFNNQEKYKFPDADILMKEGYELENEDIKAIGELYF